MIIEILELAAAMEWIALGVLVFFKLRSLKSRIGALLDEMWQKSPATLRDETQNGPGPDPKGARGAWGNCPRCGASDCEWDAETDVCTCKACGYTN
jgi:hypothetical protein